MGFAGISSIGIRTGEYKMITDSFENQSESKINPHLKENAPSVDACIVTFSYIIEQYVRDNYDLAQIGESVAVTGNLPISPQREKLCVFKDLCGSIGLCGDHRGYLIGN